LVLVFCLWGSWARAQQASTSFSLAYSVPTGCPARAAFASAVIARSRGAHLQSEAPRVALDVSLTGDAELASGTLAIQLSDGQGSHREIPAAACEQVLSSMALIAAMILDGGGLDDPPPVASVSERATLASAPPPAVGVHPDSAPHDQAALREQPGRAQEGAKRPAVSAMLGLGLQNGMAPGLVPRFFAGLGLVFERSSELAPSIDLVASVAESAREVTAYGDAQFRLVAFNLTGCPLRLAVSSGLALRPCLPFEVGVLRAAGDHTIAKRTQYMPWLGGGAGLRGELSLSRAWLLDLEGRATLLARADRFVFEPDSVVHQVPRVVFGLRLGLALQMR
jgi:hypothetical protein